MSSPPLHVNKNKRAMSSHHSPSLAPREGPALPKLRRLVSLEAKSSANPPNSNQTDDISPPKPRRVISAIRFYQEGVQNAPAETKYPLLEVCADCVASTIAAQAGGAGRVELCQSLVEGGITPSIGLVRQVLAKIDIPVNVLIRCRAGDFCYDEVEMECMLEDIRACKAAGVHGVVIGALHEDGTLHMDHMRRMMDAASGLDVTFHRAIDMCKDPLTTLDALIALNVPRVLTSGGQASALQGADLIAKLVARAAGRVQVMAGGGVNARNAGDLVRLGVSELHASARSFEWGKMNYRKPDLFMGGTKENKGFETEYGVKRASQAKIADIVLAIRTAGSD